MQIVDQKAKVLALSRDQHHHYEPLLAHSNFDLVEVATWNAEVVRNASPDILLTPTCDWYESAACIEEARRLNIPSLYIMDGIIEWRLQWESPRFGAGGGIAYNQPITTDKIACLGWQSARTLESWGNVGKCEIVGAARFDHYLSDPVARASHDGPKRLLVMTANTPGFTPEQVAVVERSLLDVQEALSRQEGWEPIWRVRRGLDEKLGLQDRFPELRGRPLRQVLAQADAVLTTASTVILEAMLAGLPTAMLDYFNNPAYVPTAWTVSVKEHLEPLLDELSEPAARRLIFQDEILHNCLECRTPAAPRLFDLMSEMIAIGRKARAAQSPLVFPDRMIPVEFGGHALPSEHFDLARLYPGHPLFSDAEIGSLQRKLIFAQQQLEKQQAELDLRNLDYWASVVGRKISRYLNPKGGK